MSVRDRMRALLSEMDSPAAGLETMLDWPPGRAPAALKATSVQAPRKEGFKKGAKQRYSALSKNYFQISKDGTES